MTGTVLVTGGTGTLGRVVVDRLLERGNEVRLLSRRDQPPGHRKGTWVTGDLRTGACIDQAVAGADTIVHCATSGRGDAAATRTLIDAAKSAGAGHLVYISIVGIDDIPMFYYRAKLQAERLIEQSGMGWTILRATQFHDLVAGAISAQRRLPAVLAPAGVRFQPIDVGDVANRLVGLAERDPSRRVADIGGPQVRTADNLARTWLRSRGIRRPVLQPRLPGKTMRALAAGANLVPGHADGVVTFDDYLANRQV